MLFGEEKIDVPKVCETNSSKERILKRWIRTEISEIFIPATLLQSRHSLKKNPVPIHGFRALDKFGSSDFKQSFSIYSHSDDEIFSSDSDQEFLSRAPPQKGKKGKRAKSMPLDQFLQTVDSSALPERDEFYESIVRAADTRERLSDFPSLGRTLVIRNIPGEVPKEHIEDLLGTFGELVHLKKEGDFLRAEFRMDPEVDLEWIISCMNGNQPFGGHSTVLEVYEKI